MRLWLGRFLGTYLDLDSECDRHEIADRASLPPGKTVWNENLHCAEKSGWAESSDGPNIPFQVCIFEQPREGRMLVQQLFWDESGFALWEVCNVSACNKESLK